SERSRSFIAVLSAFGLSSAAIAARRAALKQAKVSKIRFHGFFWCQRFEPAAVTSDSIRASGLTIPSAKRFRISLVSDSSSSVACRRLAASSFLGGWQKYEHCRNSRFRNIRLSAQQQ